MSGYKRDIDLLKNELKNTREDEKKKRKDLQDKVVLLIDLYSYSYLIMHVPMPSI